MLTRQTTTSKSYFVEQILTKCPSLLLQTMLNVNLRFMLQQGMDILIPWNSHQVWHKSYHGDLEMGIDQANVVREIQKHIPYSSMIWLCWSGARIAGVWRSWFFIFCQHRPHDPILHSRRRDVDLLIILLEKFIGDRDRGGKRKEKSKKCEEGERGGRKGKRKLN